MVGAKIRIISESAKKNVVFYLVVLAYLFAAYLSEMTMVLNQSLR